MTGIAAGFGNPVRDAQAVFRAVLQAMAEPGSLQPLAVMPARPDPDLSESIKSGSGLHLEIEPFLSENRLTLFGNGSEAPLPASMAAVALTLLDYETPIALLGPLDVEPRASFLAFHTGAPAAQQIGKAAFVFALEASDLHPLHRFAAGEPDYPDRSATLVVAVDSFDEGLPVSLSGPGITGQRIFRAANCGRAFWKEAQANAASYPLGVDFIFCGRGALAALPRSTRIAFEE